jgi:hypothetical protein
MQQNRIRPPPVSCANHTLSAKPTRFGVCLVSIPGRHQADDADIIDFMEWFQVNAIKMFKWIYLQAQTLTAKLGFESHPHRRRETNAAPSCLES